VGLTPHRPRIPAIPPSVRTLPTGGRATHQQRLRPTSRADFTAPRPCCTATARPRTTRRHCHRPTLGARVPPATTGATHPRPTPPAPLATRRCGHAAAAPGPRARTPIDPTIHPGRHRTTAPDAHEPLTPTASQLRRPPKTRGQTQHTRRTAPPRPITHPAPPAAGQRSDRPGPGRPNTSPQVSPPAPMRPATWQRATHPRQRRHPTPSLPTPSIAASSTTGRPGTAQRCPPARPSAPGTPGRDKRRCTAAALTPKPHRPAPGARTPPAYVTAHRPCCTTTAQPNTTRRHRPTHR
jgi:hypothetical protein